MQSNALHVKDRFPSFRVRMAQDRGVKASGFYVIKNTNMPAVLTETGFLSNPTENAQLMNPAFQDKIAKALVAAIREYYQSYQ